MFIKSNKIAITLFGIILLGAYFRFFNYPVRYNLDIDATRDAILVQYAAAHHLVPMVGALSALGSFSFGPWYYYQLILFQTILPFTYTPWIYVSLTSLITIILMYLIGKELLNKQFGLMLGLLTAVSPGQIIAGEGLSNPDVISLFSTLSLFLLILILKGKKVLLTALLLGISIGIGVNCHYQMTYFVFLPIFLPFFARGNRFKILLVSLLGIFLTFLPLLYFNLTHHWQTVSGFLDYYVYGKNRIYVPNRWLIYLFDFWPTFWGYVFGFPAFVGLFIMASSVFVSLLATIKRKVSLSYMLIFIFFVFCFIMIRYFSGERVNYYLIFLHPFLITFTGFVLWLSLKLRFGKVIFALLVAVMVVVAISKDLIHIIPSGPHLQYVSQEQMLEMQYPNKKFSILACDKQYRNQVQAIVFLMSNKNLLGDNVKIGFRDAHCIYPPKIATTVVLNSIDAIDLSSYSEKELKTYKWTVITPQYLYNSLLNY